MKKIKQKTVQQKKEELSEQEMKGVAGGTSDRDVKPSPPIGDSGLKSGQPGYREKKM